MVNLEVILVIYLRIMVPRRGRRTLYILVYLQILIFDLNLESGPKSGPSGMGVDHLYSRIKSKLNRTATLFEWRQLLSS